MEFETQQNQSGMSGQAAGQSGMGSGLSPAAGGHKKSSKTILIILIILVIILGAIWYMFKNYTPQAPEEGIDTTQAGAPVMLENDTTDTIQGDLDRTDFGDIDAEFQDVDQELQNL